MIDDSLRAILPVLERLVAILDPEEIWLFGSRAESRERPGSDWDLLVVLPDGAPPEHLDPATVWRSIRGVGVPVDVVPCTRSEFDQERNELDTLPRAAVLRGRRLYVHPA